MRTLVVSDLHLGASGGRALLSDPGCLRALCGAVAQADRLVLLGDVVELREGPARSVVAVARPALEAIAAALGDAAPIVLLAGNHDHGLIAPWLYGRDPAVALGVAAEVDVAAAGAGLGAVVDALGGARVTVGYPGVWLRDDVWMTHGHYADRHTTVPMLERLGAGVMARLVREGRGGPQRAEDYEAALAPMYAWIDALASLGGAGARGDGGLSVGAWETLAGAGSGTRSPSLARRLRRGALSAAFAGGVGVVSRTVTGPLSADLHGGALRRGALAGMGEAARRLAVDARWVGFGHTHRAGPLPGDDPGEWRVDGGAPRSLVNVGCWVREPLFEGGDASRSPYRPGFAAWISSQPGTAPELGNLLD